MSQAIIDKLDRLAEYQSQRDVLNMDKQAAIDSILTPEIKERLAEVEAEFGGKVEAVTENLAALEAEVRADVLTQGETVRGFRLQAVWSKGRTSWDDRALQGYMKAHPELAEFRKQGEPSVSIRVI
ncbi:MAG: hypothetical protein XU15_C0011G0054 [candidate division NC10 bacterium CSP1-5]|nr:MAG: hypothetical protein XU15_C0011G0054 [candidate division NC10 bacterium CSP1-5]